MKGEKVSTPLDKDGRGPCGLYNTHTVKALPPTSWHLTMFCHSYEFFFLPSGGQTPKVQLPFFSSPHLLLFLQPKTTQQSPRVTLTFQPLSGCTQHKQSSISLTMEERASSVITQTPFSAPCFRRLANPGCQSTTDMPGWI